MSSKLNPPPNWRPLPDPSLCDPHTSRSWAMRTPAREKS